MKRNEKNLASRRKILDSALAEFGAKGYGLSSVNAICSSGNISKGILYHYFKDKDELYLACIQELFDSLTEHLTCALMDISDTKSSQLERYFDARLQFFHVNPFYHRLFCDVVITPPSHLSASIFKIRVGFDALNISTLTGYLQKVKLRSDMTIEAAVETFRLYQDFINVRYHMENGAVNLEQHEETCKRSITILLYGIVEREAD